MTQLMPKEWMGWREGQGGERRKKSRVRRMVGRRWKERSMVGEIGLEGWSSEVRRGGGLGFGIG